MRVIEDHQSPPGRTTAEVRCGGSLYPSSRQFRGATGLQVASGVCTQ